MKKIYVLMRGCGDYDDYRESPVIAFLDNTSAEKYMKEYEIENEKKQKECKTRKQELLKKVKHPYDKNDSEIWFEIDKLQGMIYDSYITLEIKEINLIDNRECN